MNEKLILQQLVENGTLSASVIAELENMTKQKKVNEIHQTKLYNKADGRIFTKVLDGGKQKQIIAKDESELYCKLYEYYFGDLNSSLESLFPKWMEWRRNESSVTDKTLRENNYIYNAHLQYSEIVKIPLKNLTPKNFIGFFREITKKGNMTRKRFNDVKSILNGVIYYAVELDIITHNHIRDINYRKFAFKPEDKNVIPYTEEERNMILSHLGNDIYSCAIKFQFYTGLRISEIRGLRWTDIFKNQIYIQRFIDDKNNVIEHIKGNTSQGKRYIPLVEGAVNILAQVKSISTNNEYIFYIGNNPLVSCTYNRHIKKCCDELNIRYLSSHKIRFSFVSILSKNGMSITELQQLCGHTTSVMTSHYIRNITSSDETFEKMNSIL